LIFLLQKNIVKNKSLAKYERWFDFAEKTKNENNKEEDFKEYMNDEIFCEIIRRLSRSELNEEDIIYIENEKKFWEEVERLERGIYKEGLEEGLEVGMEEGIEIGKKEGEKSKAVEIAKKLKTKGIDYSIISETSGLTIEEIEKL
jgi:predicted transposase/invertase (TIGR01784 family)